MRSPALHSFLAGLSAERMTGLAQLAIQVRFRAGEPIFRQRDVADGFYLLRQGSVELSYGLPGQRAVVIQRLGAGELLGLSWLFPPFRWQFSATAIDAVEADFFRATEVRAACARDPQLGYELMERMAQALTDRLQATRHKLLVFIERASGDCSRQQVC